jgi:hypothetical protein
VTPHDSHEEQPVDPFAAARVRKPTEITVEWTVADIQSMRPDWTPRECEEFMQRIAARFAAGILALGLSLIRALATDPRFGAIGRAASSDTDGGNPVSPES